MPEHTLVVRSHSDVDSSWEIVARTPARWLRPYVRGLWAYSERTPGPVRRREMPSGGITVVLNLGTKLYVEQSADGEGERFTSFIAGLHERYAITETDGSQMGVQLNLSPLGARVLFGVPMHELAHQTHSLASVLGRRVDELVEQLDADAGGDARTARVEAVLADWLADARPPRRDIAWACARIEASGGASRIEDIAAELGWSRKRMADTFRDAVGLPAKSYARLIRFHRAFEMLRGVDPPPWSRLAQCCGYYDQSHMIRDFRAFSGMAPAALARSLLPEGAGIADA